MEPSDDNYPLLKIANDLANKGVKKDESKNYEEALKLYEESTKYLLLSYNSEGETKYIKEEILKKYKQFQERMQYIDKILQKRSKLEIISKKKD